MNAQLQPVTQKRRYVRRPQGRSRGCLCSKCGVFHERNARYCATCHAQYMREWRKLHPLTPEQREKDNARSMANVYKRRGKLSWAPCERCGSVHSEMHHDDYTKPLDVRWLCRPCHLELHSTMVSRESSAQSTDAQVVFNHLTVSR